MKYKPYWLILIVVFEILGNIRTSIPVSAKQPIKHNQSQRYSKKYKIGNTIYEISKPKVRHKLTHQQINKYIKQIKLQTWNDIKEDRAENVAPSIHINHKLNHLASIRAKQISHHFSHYSKDNHTPMTHLDAKQARLPKSFQGSENIASESVGPCTMFDDPKIYHNHNGKDMANMSNDGMMNYDSFENNGHRKNILDSDNKLIGIGAAYNPSKKTFYLVEDFGNLNPRSSEDIQKPRLFSRTSFLDHKFNYFWHKIMHYMFILWHKLVNWISSWL